MMVVSTWNAKKAPGTAPDRTAAWITGSCDSAPRRVR